MHICQQTPSLCGSTGYGLNILVSHIIHPISQIKSTYELFYLLQFETQPIFPKFKIICFRSNVVWLLLYFGMYFITYKHYFINIALEATFGGLFYTSYVGLP